MKLCQDQSSAVGKLGKTFSPRPWIADLQIPNFYGFREFSSCKVSSCNSVALVFHFFFFGKKVAQYVGFSKVSAQRAQWSGGIGFKTFRNIAPLIRVSWLVCSKRMAWFTDHFCSFCTNCTVSLQSGDKSYPFIW